MNYGSNPYRGSTFPTANGPLEANGPLKANGLPTADSASTAKAPSRGSSFFLTRRDLVCPPSHSEIFRSAARAVDPTETPSNPLPQRPA